MCHQAQPTRGCQQITSARPATLVFSDAQLVAPLAARCASSTPSTNAISGARPLGPGPRHVVDLSPSALYGWDSQTGGNQQ